VGQSLTTRAHGPRGPCALVPICRTSPCYRITQTFSPSAQPGDGKRLGPQSAPPADSQPTALDDGLAATDDPLDLQGVLDLVPEVFDRLSDPVLDASEPHCVGELDAAAGNVLPVGPPLLE